MKISNILLALTFSLGVLSTSCDSETGDIGTTIMPAQDSLSTYNETFPVYTKSVKTGAVIANTSNCFIGSIIDPETNVVTTSGFLAQFHLQEDYSLPDISTVITNTDGTVKADSCVLRILHDKFYGDSLNTMKLTVTDLRLDNIMEEGQAFYTDINPQDYTNPTPRVHKSATYTVLDQTLSKEETSLSSGNYRSIPVHLGEEYGSYILNSYYKNPEFFKNSYTFIHNVCPGFYVEHTGGIGTMINTDVSVLDVYFRYKNDKNVSTQAWMRLAATQEVIQNTHFEHDNVEQLFDEEGQAYDEDGHAITYIKSPAGVHTELILPIDQIASGEHYNDTLNSARLTLRRLAAKEQGSSTLPTPSHLLLIRKGQADKFFTNHQLPNNETSFLCAFSPSNNSYTFTNIAPMISFIRKMRDNEAGILPSDNEEQRKKKWEAWEKLNPDWQTFELLPVVAEYSTTSSTYYGSKQTLVGVSNAYNMQSVRLEGSNEHLPDNEKLQLQVIYSRFLK